MTIPSTFNTCLQCSKPITKGRIDKKFCDINCKDNYYNAIKISELKQIRLIDIKLKRNRRILKSLFKPSEPESTINRDKLIRAGFEFGFMTHIAITQFKENEINFCYDYGYREIAPDLYRIYSSFGVIRIKGGELVQVL